MYIGYSPIFCKCNLFAQFTFTFMFCNTGPISVSITRLSMGYHGHPPYCSDPMILLQWPVHLYANAHFCFMWGTDLWENVKFHKQSTYITLFPCLRKSISRVSIDWSTAVWLQYLCDRSTLGWTIAVFQLCLTALHRQWNIEGILKGTSHLFNVLLSFCQWVFLIGICGKNWLVM